MTKTRVSPVQLLQFNLNIDDFHDFVGANQDVGNEIRNENSTAHVCTNLVTRWDRCRATFYIFSKPITNGRNIKR